MSCRPSVVGRIYVNTVSNASVLQFGDNRDGAKLFTRVLAVQRSIASFGNNEFRFSFYSLFARPLPVAPPPAGPQTYFYSEGAPIEIGELNITGLTAASHARIGCGGPETAETRIVNIRNAIPGVKPLVDVEFE